MIHVSKTWTSAAYPRETEEGSAPLGPRECPGGGGGRAVHGVGVRAGEDSELLLHLKALRINQLCLVGSWIPPAAAWRARVEGPSGQLRTSSPCLGSAVSHRACGGLACGAWGLLHGGFLHAQGGAAARGCKAIRDGTDRGRRSGDSQVKPSPPPATGIICIRVCNRLLHQGRRRLLRTALGRLGAGGRRVLAGERAWHLLAASLGEAASSVALLGGAGPASLLALLALANLGLALLPPRGVFGPMAATASGGASYLNAACREGRVRV